MFSYEGIPQGPTLSLLTQLALPSHFVGVFVCTCLYPSLQISVVTCSYQYTVEPTL